MTLRRNVLIFHTGALGDFLLNWPLAMALGRIHPQSRVIYVTHPAKGALASRLLRIESTSIENGWHHLHGTPTKLPETSRKLLEGAHSIYSFIATSDDAWSKNVKELAPAADLVCLEPTPPPDFAGHATDFLLGQLQGRKALAEAVRQMLISINDRGLMSAAVNRSGPLAIHPGSGSPAKCWPAERFLEVAREVKAPVRFVLGEVELERWPQERIKSFEAAGEVVKPTSYLELMNALSGCRAFIGNDSGPGHLAAMMGLPTVSLFGPTSERVWRPLGPKVQVVQGTTMRAISVQEVTDAVKSDQ
jgi:heptosyltransferase-3